MKSKIFATIFLITSFFGITSILPKEDYAHIKEVISPNKFIIENYGQITFENIETFDPFFSEKNYNYAKSLNISEEEAFIIGNIAKNWTKNLMQGRRIKYTPNDFHFYKYSYQQKFLNTAFGIKNGEILNKQKFQNLLKTIHQDNYYVLDTDTNISYSISDFKELNIKNYVLLPKNKTKNIEIKFPTEYKNQRNYTKPSYKLIFSDSTTRLKPDRNCSSEICKEILTSINNAKSSIDIAIYGYTTTHEIENALKNALLRGVKIRLVYDTDAAGGNIYPNTKEFIKLFDTKTNDKNSPFTMHNKFYIFDNQKVITGSANLSHTDMSGYNSNCIISIHSKDIANFYKQEFEQMYRGKFHQDKISNGTKSVGNIKIFFSPQDKTIKNGVLPLIRNAEKYIYIPTFVITEQRIVDEIIAAKKRGVEIKIILDALSASNKHSKHEILRQAGIALKTENYAGKMHSKTILIDDKYTLVGSMNFSNSGEYRNDENCLIIEDSSLTKNYKAFFLYQWNKIPNKWLSKSVKAESWDSIGSCEDGIDNDYDGKTDSADSNCSTETY